VGGGEKGSVKTRHGTAEGEDWLLSFIDDVHGSGVGVGGKKELDEAMEGAAAVAGIKWEHA